MQVLFTRLHNYKSAALAWQKMTTNPGRAVTPNLFSWRITLHKNFDAHLRGHP